MSRLKWWVSVAGVPLAVCLVVGWLLRFREEAWQRQLQEKQPLAVEALRRVWTIDRACEENLLAGDRTCIDQGRLDRLRWAAAGSTAIGVGLTLSLWAAGRWSRRRPPFLAAIFSPGLQISLTIFVTLWFVNSFLFVPALYYGVLYRFQISSGLATAAAGTAAALVGWQLLREAFEFGQELDLEVFGHLLVEGEHPGLWHRVRMLARQTGAPSPQQIIGGLDGFLFATSEPVKTLDGVSNGLTLFLSLPLCRILSESELSALVSHELAHFGPEDVAVTGSYSPSRRAVERWRESKRKGLRGVGASILSTAVDFYLHCFRSAERGVRRARELRADAAGARAAGPLAMGSAVLKVSAYSELCVGAADAVASGMRSQLPPETAGRYFVRAVQRRSAAALEGNPGRTVMPHPVDAHATLRERLSGLGVAMEDAKAAAEEIAPARSGLAMVDAGTRIEEQLSGRIRDAVVAQGQA